MRSKSPNQVQCRKSRSASKRGAPDLSKSKAQRGIEAARKAQESRNGSPKRVSAAGMKHIKLLKQQKLISTSAIKGQFSNAKPKFEQIDNFD